MKKYLSIMLMGMVLSSTSLLASANEIQHEDKMPQAIEKTEKDLVKKTHLRKQYQENFAKRLNLTAEQQKQAEEIRLKTKPKMEEIFSKMKELKKQADEIRAQNKKEFESILTNQQKETLEQMKKEHKQKRKMKKHHIKK